MASIVQPVSAPTRRGLRRAGRDTGGGLEHLHRARPLTYALLIAAILGSVFPLYWSFVVSSQTNDVVAQPNPALLPGSHFLENARRVFEQTEFQKALMNSLIAASAITLSTVLFCSLAGFAFAKLRFRGRNALFLFIIATMLVPVQLGIIPLYMLMGRIGWNAHLQAVIVPMMVTAFGVFWMRQFIAEAVPDELLDAGRVDGCSTLRLYWHVILPAIRPAAAVLGMLTFMQAWNDFFWPLVVLGPDNPTVQVAIATLRGGYYQDYSLVLAGTALGTLPILVFLLVFGRQIIGGIMEGAIKG
jgi:cellobiose transport system permease protein